MTKRQKLIHLHSGQVKANKPLVATALTKGEIAVRHANEEPELYIRKEDDTLATFIDEKAISKKITDVTDVISAKLEALSGATEDLVSTVVGDYVTSESLEETLEGVTNGINSTIGTLSGRVDTHDAKFTTLEKNIDDYKALVGETYVTKSEYDTHERAFNAYTAATDNAITDITKEGGAIDTAVAAAKVASSAYTDAKIEAVKNLIDAEKARIDELKVSAATKVELGAQSGRIDTLVSQVTTITGTTIPDAKADAIKDATEASSAYTNAEIAKVKSDVIAPLNTKVTTLIGEDSGKTVRAIAKAEVQLLVGSAPEALDTLEEIATWIESDSAGTVALVNKVTDLETVANFASGHTVDLEKEFDEFKESVGKTYATKVELGAQSGRIDTLVSQVTTITGTTIPNAKADAIKDATEASSAYTDAKIEAVKNLIDAEKARIDELKVSAATKVELGAQSGRVDTLETEVSTLKTTTIPAAQAAAVKAATEASSAYTNAQIAKIKDEEIAGLDGRVDSLESISGLSYTAIHEIDYNVINGNGFSVKTAQIESATTGATLSMEFDLSELVIDCGEF